jgi:hypothetical protein
MRLTLVFLDPTKIYILIMNEPGQIWGVILEEHDEIISQQNLGCIFLQREQEGRIESLQKEFLQHWRVLQGNPAWLK